MADVTQSSVTVKKEELPLTQERFDEIYRKYREAEERVQRMQNENISIQQENLSLRSAFDEQLNKPELKVVQTSREQKKEMSDEEWNQWFNENPGVAIDWRNKRTFEKEREKTQKQTQDQDFLTAQAQSRERLVEKHPDMYRKNTDGSVMRTSEGIPLLDVGSPKVAIFNEIVRKDPDLTKIKTGPEKAMYEMEKIMAERDKSLSPDEIAKKAKEEGIREAQTAAASAEAGYTAGSSGASGTTSAGEEKITLSNEEKRTADKLRVSYKDYQEQKKHVRRAPRTKVEYE